MLRECTAQWKEILPQQVETQTGGAQRRRHRLRLQDEAQGDAARDGDQGGLSPLYGLHLAGLSPVPLAHHQRAHRRCYGRGQPV